MLLNVHSETQKLQRQNANVPSFAKRVLASFSRDRWGNCRLNSSNSIGSECCLEFVIFLQPMVRVTIIHDWVTAFIVVHDRFTTNGYALPVPHVRNHKMDLQWKPHTCSIWSSDRNFCSSAWCLHLHMQIADTKMDCYVWKQSKWPKSKKRRRTASPSIWASLGRSFPPAENANFGQKWWRQKWKKGKGSSRPVMGDTGVNGLMNLPWLNRLPASC